MDRPPGKSEPIDGTIIKSQGMFKTTWSSYWKSYQSEQLEIYQDFFEVHLKNKMERFN